MRPVPLRSSPPRPLAAAAALAALCAGCASSTAPAPGTETGRYVAATANGRALPATVDTASDGFGVLLADTLVLDGGGRAVRSTAFRRVYRGPTAAYDTVYRFRTPLEYRLADGGRIELGFFTPCPPNALCAANAVGVVRADRVELDTVGNRPRIVMPRAAE